MKKKIPCFILARKNSKSLKDKNKFLLNKIPLIQHTINFAKKSKYVTDIVISTDDKKIAEIGKKNKCIVIYPRPKKLSNDQATSIEALSHAVNFFLNKYGDFEIFSFLQATEPLRPQKIMDKCIKILLNNKNIKSAFAGYEYKKNFWIDVNNKYKLLSPHVERNKPRQIRKPIFREDCGMALASRKKIILKKNKLFESPFEIVPYSSFHGFVDIHKLEDIKLAEILIKFDKNRTK